MDIISILIGITIFSVIVCLIVMYIALQGIATAVQETEEAEKIEEIEEQPELKECEFCGFLTDSPCTEPPAALCEQAMDMMDRQTGRLKY